MIPIEKKLITFLEKHMILLAALLVTGMAFFLRRQSIWYYTQDFYAQFDMHEGSVQSCFYGLLVYVLGNLSVLPLHGIKWLAGLADFAVAALLVLLVREEAVKKGRMTELAQYKLLAVYAGCLMAPVCFLRGSVWAQVDSLAFAFLLGAVVLFSRYGKRVVWGAVLLAGVGVALYPAFLIPVIWYCMCELREETGFYRYLWVLPTVVMLLLQIVAALFLQGTWQQGVISCFQWLTRQPVTGSLFANVPEFLWYLLLHGGYGIAMLALIAAFRSKLSFYWAVAIQVLVAVCYSVQLGW